MRRALTDGSALGGLQTPDLHAEAIPWPGPSVTSITQPTDLGPFQEAELFRIPFLRRHAIFGDSTGLGKSGGLNVLMANLTACTDVIIWPST